MKKINLWITLMLMTSMTYGQLNYGVQIENGYNSSYFTSPYSNLISLYTSVSDDTNISGGMFNGVGMFVEREIFHKFLVGINVQISTAKDKSVRVFNAGLPISLKYRLLNKLMLEGGVSFNVPFSTITHDEAYRDRFTGEMIKKRPYWAYEFGAVYSLGEQFSLVLNVLRSFSIVRKKINVYPYSGSSDNDGYLSSDLSADDFGEVVNTEPIEMGAIRIYNLRQRNFHAFTLGLRYSIKKRK